jgi:hypothetical protein
MANGKVLHPSFKDEYFKIAGWDKEWIDDVISHTREMWINHYKPKPIPTASKSVNSSARVSFFQYLQR